MHKIRDRILILGSIIISVVQRSVAGGSENSKNPTSSYSSGSKWKSLMNSIAKQVSQVRRPSRLIIKFKYVS